jgi:hypothetical protein
VSPRTGPEAAAGPTAESAAEPAAGPAGEQDGDALDELIRRATQRRDRRA